MNPAEMFAELEKLEERIAEAAETIRVLLGRNRELEKELASLREDRSRYAEERAALTERIARLVDRVDALRMEL